MEFFGLLIIGAIAWYFFSSFLPGFLAGLRGTETKQHCMACGSEADPITKTKGSILIEIVLWPCFIVPGLIYSLWRITSRQPVCAVCGAANLIPTDSPAARSHREQLQRPAA